MNYKLYEYEIESLKIGLIISEKEQLLYIGNKLHSAKTNLSPERNTLNSDITGHGLVQITLDPLTVIITGQKTDPTYEHEEPDKTKILQHWYSRLKK